MALHRKGEKNLVKWRATRQFLPASGRKSGFDDRRVCYPRQQSNVMSLKNFVLVTALWVALTALTQAAEPVEAVPQVSGAPMTEVGHADVPAAAEHEHHGLPSAAVPLFNVFGLPVSNSMLVTWIVALGLIIFARVALRRVQTVPSGAQNFWEWIVESVYEFLEGILGRDLAKRTFWFFTTIFIFILFTNWMGLVPGVGTIGWGKETGHGFLVEEPLLRGGNADLNMTFAMAAIFMVLWLGWALRANGMGGFLLHIFGPKGDNTGFIKYLMIVVFFVVGFLEIVSIAFRPISLSFRLYGNIFAGENLLESLAGTIQHPAWAKAVFSALLPVPFYFLGLLVGLVQAFVFMLLTTVFTALICVHDEEHEKGHH
jgi:F-type H+-transporting ATPase subunit a